MALPEKISSEISPDSPLSPEEKLKIGSRLRRKHLNTVEAAAVKRHSLQIRKLIAMRAKLLETSDSL